MKKQFGLNKSRSAVLRPLDHRKKDVPFRTLSKFRNQENGVGLMTPQLKKQGANTLRHSQHTQPVPNRFSEANSPIKQFVKQMKTKAPNNLSHDNINSSRSRLDTENCNESRVSTYSQLNGRASSCSRISKREGSLIENKKSQIFSLEELKVKVEHLLELNIQRCKLMQGKGQVQDWVDLKKSQEVQSQLLLIQESLKNPREEEYNLTEVIARIDVIESALSGQMGEAEAVKKNYFNKRNQYFNTSSHVNKHKLRESLILNAKIEKNLISKSSPKDYIYKCASTSQDYYKAPKRQHYVPAVKNLRKYEHNRDKMPPTSYNTQFPHYKTGGTFPSQEPFRKPLPETKLAVKNSSYQNDFNDKSGVKIIDYRQLDCAKNKLKNIQLSFMDSSKKPEWSQIPKQSKKKVMEKQNVGNNVNILGKFELKNGGFGMGKMFETQNNKHYVDHREGSGIMKSTPKNKQLLKMKENFRLLAQGV